MRQSSIHLLYCYLLDKFELPMKTIRHLSRFFFEFNPISQYLYRHKVSPSNDVILFT